MSINFKEVDVITAWLNISTTVNSLTEVKELHKKFENEQKIIDCNHLLDEHVFKQFSGIACLSTNLSYISHCLKTDIGNESILLDVIDKVLVSPEIITPLENTYSKIKAFPSFLNYSITNNIQFDELSASYFLNLPNLYAKIFKLDNQFPQKIWLSIPLILIGQESIINNFKQKHLDRNISVFSQEFIKRFKNIYDLSEDTVIHNITDKYNLFETMYDSDKKYLFEVIEKKCAKKESYFFDFEDIRIIIHDGEVYLPFMTYDNFKSRTDLQTDTYPEYIATFNETKEFLAQKHLIPHILHYAPSLYANTAQEMHTIYSVLNILKADHVLFFTEQRNYSGEIFKRFISNNVCISQYICGIPVYKLQYFYENEFSRILCKEKVLYFTKKESLLNKSAKQLLIELLMIENNNCNITMHKDAIPFSSLNQSMFD